jgi:hypothetical protein
MTPPERPERQRRVEGNVVHLQTQLRARLRSMIVWEARLNAREIVKRKLKVEGVKVSLLSASTITRLAQEHLRQHAAELLAQAEASGVVQKLRHSINARRAEPQAFLLCRCHARNGERNDYRICEGEH